MVQSFLPSCSTEWHIAKTTKCKNKLPSRWRRFELISDLAICYTWWTWCVTKHASFSSKDSLITFNWHELLTEATIVFIRHILCNFFHRTIWKLKLTQSLILNIFPWFFSRNCLKQLSVRRSKSSLWGSNTPRKYERCSVC